MSITPWRDRLDWTGERSPDMRAIRKAMEAEIKELRAVVAKADRQVQAAIKRADQRADRRIQEHKERADEWRKAAFRYRERLLKQL